MKNSKTDVAVAALGIVPVIWLALLTAPHLGGGLVGIFEGLSAAMDTPTAIEICKDSVKTVLIFLLIYAFGVGMYFSSRKNYRRREEHGSAKWGNPAAINRRYADKNPAEAKILTQNVRLGLDGRKHRRNLNVLVVGGSGAGKTRFYAKPNIFQANRSYVCLDPKGEILRDCGHLLAAKGYEIRVLDLINMERSHCYNPFHYLTCDNDVQRLVTNLFKNTTPKGAQSQDPFWDSAASVLLMALVFFLHYEAPPEEQNFAMVLEMLRAADVREDDDEFQSPLDILFDQLEMDKPGHIALKYYRNYRSGSGKTLKSIHLVLASRLDRFNLSSLEAMTMTDELDLGSMGERKIALFACIPDNDSSFNFLVGLLYTQLFQQLYFSADQVHGGRLPVHVHFIMDEFANVALPDDFQKLLSTMRSREISVSIILQNMAQLKALYEKDWESIVGNADTFLYIGGNEASTHKYVSEMLGKSTIDVNTYGHSFGRNGNYSKNDQNAGRELLTPDEVRLMDNRYALLFIRGERPVMDLKYDPQKHPNAALSADGSAPPYVHNQDKLSYASLRLSKESPPEQAPADPPQDFDLFCDEDADHYFKMIGDPENES